MTHGKWELLGDQGWLGTFATESEAAACAAAVRAADWPWVADVVVAYCSVAVYCTTPGILPPNAAADLANLKPSPAQSAGRAVTIPCWYDPQSDLPWVAEFLRLPVAEVIRLHANRWYTVFAIGFVPGFPYLGYLPEELQGVPRLATPRPRVPAGSVAITGKQTAIYPTDTPGGWRLLGRSPCLLVDVAAGYFPLRTGDRVRFLPIDEKEYQHRLGERLTGS
jgi:inhibitor of KinA